MTLTDHEKKVLDNNLLQIIDDSYAMSTGAIWFCIEKLIPADHQKDGFLYVLEQLLRQGRVKIGREHRLLNMSIEEVIQRFRDNWPSDEEFDDAVFSFIDDPKIGGYRFWTPGDLVWIDPDDGHELWSTDADY